MSTIKKQSLLGTLFSYAGVVVGFFSQGILIPNLLTKDQNGLLGVILSFVYIFAQIAALGFNSAGSRFFPYFSDGKGNRGFLFTGLMISLLGFLVGSFIYYFLKPMLLETSSGKSVLLEEYYYLVLVVVLGTILFNLFDNYAKNLYETVTGTFLNQFLQRFIIFVGLLMILFFNISFESFVWIWTTAFIIPTILMISTAYRLGNFSLKPDFSVFTPDFKQQFFSYSGITVLTGFSSMVIMYIDKIMLNHYSGLEETGIYNTASFFGSIMGMSLISMNKAAVPVIVQAFKNEDHTTISTIYKKSCMIQLIIGGLVYGGIVLNLDAFFELIPQGYEAGKIVIIIICLGKLFDLATGLNGTILNLSKYYKYDSIMIASLIVLTVVANMIFIPLYGLIGAAVAAIFSTLYFNFMRTFIVWKKLHIQPFNFDTIKVLLIAIAIICSIYYLVPHMNGSILNNIFDITIRSILFSVAYVGIMYKLNVSAEMNDIINNFFSYIKSLLK
jgi:O-antigen/teichoic acid export membrane protein